MVFGYRFAKKGVVLLIIAALLVAALGIVAVAYGGSPDSAEADSAFVKEDEVVFAHITDTHYYSAAYCGDITATDTGYYDYQHENGDRSRPLQRGGARFDS